MAKVWDQSKTEEEAIKLPKGTLVSDFGYIVAQISVDSSDVYKAAAAIKQSGQSVTVATQASLLVKAQQLGLLPEYEGKLMVG